ncbi:DUF551 domain-containing protein [Shigella flexneri]|nr:DUF551 domain-containing protein [Shigella flexneri]EIH4975643.1 DUF551 domain-containing protein [Shigella flexneri]
MTTITKERLLTIKQWRETYGPGSNVVLPAEEAEELVRIALASLEAEPVAYIFKHPAGKLFWALTDESNKEQADVIPVYAAAPASVVPDNASEPLAYAYKELTPEIMRNHLAVFERYGIAPNDSSTTIQALRIALDGIERSDAMLHGAEPVSQTYKLPPLSSNEVNDAAWKLHNMLTEHGPLNGRQFNNLKGCFYEALKVAMRNYPVTPDGWISCSERMPEDTKMLLAFSQGQIVAAYWNWVMSPIDYKKYRAFTYLSGNILDDVTHWMPLLEPPEQDGE